MNDSSGQTRKMKVIFRVNYNRDGQLGSISFHEHDVTDFDVIVDGKMVFDSSSTRMKEE